MRTIRGFCWRITEAGGLSYGTTDLSGLFKGTGFAAPKETVFAQRREIQIEFFGKPCASARSISSEFNRGNNC
jgi:hypothetical protein